MREQPRGTAPLVETAALGKSQFRKVFLSIMLPMFLAVIDQTIVSTALPAIGAALGNVERVSWVVIAYLVAGTVAAPVYGQLGDGFGRRRLMLIALPIFMAASLLCASASSMVALTLARALQGLGGGGLMTLSQALIGEAVPARERGRYQGYLAAVIVCSNSFGPVVGGYLTQHLGWRSIFLVNLPLGICAILLTLRLEAKPGSRPPARFDALGLALFVLFIGPTLVAMAQVAQWSTRTPLLIASLTILGIGSLVLLWRHEKRIPSPLLPIGLLRQPGIWRSDALAACHGAALVSLITFLPIYFRATRGMSASETGAMLVPLTIGIGIGSMITGRIVTKTGRTSIFPSLGLILVTANLAALAAWAQRLSAAEFALMLLWNGLFMGTVMGVVQVNVQSLSGPQMLGAAAASVQFSRSVGAAFGTATVAAVLFSTLTLQNPEVARLFGALLNQGPGLTSTFSETAQSAIRSSLALAFRAGFLTMAAFSLLGLILAWSTPIRRV
jgi:EmrB/QacA subfamily drug resistance transporter